MQAQQEEIDAARQIIGDLGSGQPQGAPQRDMQQMPKVHPSECIGCRKCFNVCPARAITMVKGKPKIDRKRCIRCFCCQEFCPRGAMKVHRTLLARLLQ